MISSTAQLYRIILRGECGQLLADVIDPVAIESCLGWTCVVVSVRDESEFYGILDRFQDLTLHIVSLSEVSADAWDRGVRSGERHPGHR